MQSACLININPLITEDHMENKAEDDVSRFISILHESFDASFTRSSG